MGWKIAGKKKGGKKCKNNHLCKFKLPSGPVGKGNSGSCLEIPWGGLEWNDIEQCL